MQTYTQTRANPESGEVTTKDFADPDFKLSLPYYAHLTRKEVAAFTITNRYRLNLDNSVDETIANERVIEAANYLHSIMYPNMPRPATWKLDWTPTGVRKSARNRKPLDRMFAFVTSTGKQFSFSLSKPLHHYLRYMQQEARTLINPQCKKFKDDFFDGCDTTYDQACSVCDKVMYNDDTTQVDHIRPLQEWLDIFVAGVDKKMGRDEEWRPTRVWPLNDPKKDYYLDNEWPKFHQRHVTDKHGLRVLHKACNQDAGREYKEQRIADGKSWFGNK